MVGDNETRTSLHLIERPRNINRREEKEKQLNKEALSYTPYLASFSPRPEGKKKGREESRGEEGHKNQATGRHITLS